MKDHAIVCGIGRQGSVIVDEFLRCGKPFVMIEGNSGMIDNLHQRYPHAPLVHGDAFNEEILRSAGIEQASHLVCCLSEDRDNLLLVVTAKQIRPDLCVICKVMEIPDMEKLKRAGADAVISPTFIGGMRMASEVVRPAVNSFFDRLLRDKNQALRFEEVVVRENSTAIGETLADLDIGRKTGLVVLAIRDPGSDSFHFAPDPDTKIKEGMSFVVLGNAECLPDLQSLLE